MVGLDLLSEQRFVEEYIHSRTAKGDGPLKIRRDLTRRGVDSGLVDDRLSQDAQYWIERARLLVSKRFEARKTRSKHQLKATELERKKMVFLKGKGYSIDTIRLALVDESQDSATYQ